MQITIENLGPIKYAHYDLKKDFNLIVGKNNVGKSYAVGIIYLILKSFKNASIYLNPAAFSYFYAQDAFNLKELVKSIPKKTEYGRQSDATEIISSSVKAFFNVILTEELSNSIENTFDSIENIKNRFTDEDLKITLESEETSVILKIVEDKLIATELKIKNRYVIKNGKQSRKEKKSGNTVTIYNNISDLAYLTSELHRTITNEITKVIREVRSETGNIYYMPASRSGLYQALTAFGQIIAELSQQRSFVKKKIELPGIPEPLSDYYLELSEIKDIESDMERREREPLLEIAKKIESTILKGEVTFDTEKRRILFTPYDTNFKIDLSATSSMVSELSPIVTFLRHVITFKEKGKLPRRHKDILKGKPLLIIEEPEAHLHPEIQILLTEIFSEMVTLGTKLIITSHSNYIFSKINNLILSENVKKDSVQALLFKDSENRSGSISQEMKCDYLGIDDDNFIDAAEKLIEEKMDLIEKINNDR